ncbi:MAG: hypothetical protein K2M06_07455 [Muribaculaceae bacterium]|nr:hypothetical protein [Muribaculaceae bacterium]
MTVEYSLRGVSIEQFATIFEPEGENIEFNLTIPLKANYRDRMLAVGANIQFSEDGKTFLVAEAFCHFEIREECWQELSEGNTRDVVIPKDLMDVLSRIAVGTLRGVLSAKTDNTPFSKFYLPIIKIQSPEDSEGFLWVKL